MRETPSLADNALHRPETPSMVDNAVHRPSLKERMENLIRDRKKSRIDELQKHQASMIQIMAEDTDQQKNYEEKDDDDSVEEEMSEEDLVPVKEPDRTKTSIDSENMSAEERSSNFNNNRPAVRCQEEMGRELRENNEKICEYICSLRNQREELVFIIEKQYEERNKLETEMERITYKLCLINKSMAQRIKTKNLYDKTLMEIEKNYSKLVHDSEAILGVIKCQYENLDGMLNKTTSTDENLMGSPDEQASGEPPTTHDKICKCDLKAVQNSRQRKSREKVEITCKCVNKTAKQNAERD